MTERKQNRHPLERSVKFQVWLSWSRIVSGFAGWKVFGVVVECSAGDVWGGCAEGFFGCLVLDGGGVVLGRVPDVLGRVGGRARTAAGRSW